MLAPNPGHPITIVPNAHRVTITVAGQTIADTRAALTLTEAAYPPVQYIPREDADMSLLTRSNHASYCPYKGDASYFSIPAAGPRGTNAVWTYETAFPAVAEITGYLAFYPDRVEIKENS
jgi:uncharacterized protein (DUF427 family)